MNPEKERPEVVKINTINLNFKLVRLRFCTEIKMSTVSLHLTVILLPSPPILHGMTCKPRQTDQHLNPPSLSMDYNTNCSFKERLV